MILVISNCTKSTQQYSMWYSMLYCILMHTAISQRYRTLYRCAISLCDIACNIVLMRYIIHWRWRLKLDWKLKSMRSKNYRICQQAATQALWVSLSLAWHWVSDAGSMMGRRLGLWSSLPRPLASQVDSRRTLGQWLASRNSLSDSPCPLGRARGCGRYNLLARAIKNKPFQYSDGRTSSQRRRSAARVEQGDLFKFSESKLSNSDSGPWSW